MEFFEAKKKNPIYTKNACDPEAYSLVELEGKKSFQQINR